MLFIVAIPLEAILADRLSTQSAKSPFLQDSRPPYSKKPQNPEAWNHKRLELLKREGLLDSPGFLAFRVWLLMDFPFRDLGRIACRVVTNSKRPETLNPGFQAGCGFWSPNPVGHLIRVQQVDQGGRRFRGLEP